MHSIYFLLYLLKYAYAWNKIKIINPNGGFMACDELWIKMNIICIYAYIWNDYDSFN